jgi:dTDP-glucose 4,6-dehydratase
MNSSTSLDWSLAKDIETVVTDIGETWRDLAGKRLFITGGTGFIGRWLLETLKYANELYDLDVSATILTRNPTAFHKKAPHLSGYHAFSFVAGDVRNFDFPGGRFSHVIHAATDASAELNEKDPRLMFDTVLEGTRRTLDFSLESGAEKFLNLSSGAVYGVQHSDMPRISEGYMTARDCTLSINAYAEAKRAAEMLCAIYGKQFGLKISTARIFALLGPCLPLDTHFAAGNFICDAIAGKKIVVKSSGAAERSYLYTTDLVTALWVMLLKAQPGRSYNVGSETPISIKLLAQRVSELLGKEGCDILGQDDATWNPGRYVPDTRLLRESLGISQKVSLDEAILRTAIWNGWTPWRS